MPRISLIIPAFNEETLLPTLLDTVETARRQYTFGPERVEVIVADNASTDRTAEIALLRGCRVIPVEKRAIAAARNGGAQAAQGDILAFVDADSRIHPETFNAIEGVFSSNDVVAGATGVRPERMSPALAILVAMTVPFRMAGLDSGVVFCRREDWQAVGGYNEDRLVSEDIQFLLALKRLGRSRGQRLVRVRGAQAVTSTRKFDQHGDWRFLIKLFAAPWLMLFRPASFERWVRKYWYEERL
jgi:glycosyltransferase involved in cell wall biosynthesis